MTQQPRDKSTTTRSAPPLFLLLACACSALVLALACRTSPIGAPPPSSSSAGGAAQKTPLPGTPVHRVGDEIVVCGERYHTGTRVVLFSDPRGYDAYRPHRFFEPDEVAPSQMPDRLARFGSLRRNLEASLAARVERAGWTIEDLRAAVSQVILHYDVAGTAKHCFRILHDIRGLSCHFLIDVDGTVYQTLDLKERAWHAGVANDASIGIEIAQPGAYPTLVKLNEFYATSADGATVTYPIADDRRGHIARDFVARPARPGVFRGAIHGQTYLQYDFTEEQYKALEKLLPALAKIFPRIQPKIPRDARGQLIWGVLPEKGSLFQGVLGHFHLTTAKADPGPAFDWERVERALLPLRTP